jgi:hypothetical protein
MTAIQKVIDAVLFWRDRVFVGFSMNLYARHVDLESTLGALVCANRAGHGQGSLLGEMIGTRERLIADRGFRHHRLDEARAVADDEEVDLSTGAAVVQPTVDRDLLPFMPGDV